MKIPDTMIQKWLETLAEQTYCGKRKWERFSRSDRTDSVETILNDNPNWYCTLRLEHFSGNGNLTLAISINGRLHINRALSEASLQVSAWSLFRIADDWIENPSTNRAILMVHEAIFTPPAA